MEGYDTGVISGTLVIISDDLGKTLSSWDKELITSSTTLGALLGGLISGTMSDYTGRKGVIGVASGIFVIGALGQAISHTIISITIGRFVVGVGVGLASCIVPLYIGELSPANMRGRLVTLNVVAITLGQVVAYVIGAAFQNVSGGWRWMVGLGAVPAIVQLFTLSLLPESARILLLQGKTEQVTRIIAKIYPHASQEEIMRHSDEMRSAVRESIRINESTTWRERLESLLRDGPSRRALIIGGGLQALQQLSGFNTLMYYSASLFASLGFKNATAVGGLIASVNLMFTLVALKTVDRLGRRRTMLLTVPVMIIALLLSSFFFHLLTSSTGGILVDGTPYSRSLASLVVISMMIYVAGYAAGVGNIPWQQGELFNLEVRGIGSSICTSVNWTCNLLIASTFLSLMDAISPSGAFLIYAILCVGGWFFCYFLYPETSGLTLEQVYQLFSEDFGVKKSLSSPIIYEPLGSPSHAWP
ncbi:hypothetical protein TREMEDRAFT_29066 [Tremella mesenterica DSM 1558]|uniref:uncharacterized protein n=1 Tax=Tremella mesenterica (strain ATCC 24925 / CBS 8224 / DSM 1558 / NBRC 9311 / NRRL Y-6157 / RJB 2259-6 / UBC 559-6) TaxID=578456 RepID=UPI0003F49899|nr:uncharacterized protein TREMEDRAFT_29066 [Tremella mesenterica DSM 1558]EIW70914.1 hypothetical protein TREMEDRAFT_29066 [Tremella mesenterica DSM 1558]